MPGVVLGASKTLKKKYGAHILGGWRGKSGDSRVGRGCFTRVGRKVSLKT